MKNKARKIMILGASILQLPAIIKAKEMGLTVIAVDMNKDAIGFEYADICLEISTIDTPKVVKAATKHKIDCIMTLATDMPIRTVAAVAEKLGVVGIDLKTALNVTNKALARECLKENDVPVPLFHKIETYSDYRDALRSFSKKVIVKPVDNSGSRGVFLIDDLHNSSMLEHAFEYSKNYSRSGEIIIEEFMEGPEVSVETLSVEGKVHVIAITDKLTTGAPRFVEMGHSQPSMLSENMKRKIELVTEKAVKALGLENGPAHTEIIVTKEGPKIVEVGARLGGDNITTQLVPLSTGIDMVEACILIAMGERPNLSRTKFMGAAIKYIGAPIGRIKGIEGIDKAHSIEGVEQIFFMKEVGDYSTEITSSVDRIGFVVSQSWDAQGAIEICEKAMSCIDVIIQNGES